ISAPLRTVAAWATVASVAVRFIAFSFAGFVTGCFGTTATFFGLLLVFPGFRCGRRFHDGQRSAAFDADFEFRDNVGVEAEFDIVFAEDADRMFEVNLALV